ncbi:nucleolar MIF4G domain-containing protein 1 homolog [Microplitis demolitor]|uniref:nucleolar MIF4G domain-containing protein 1 homolog n=1 Tax=Microplitis demolitor TaxID=69319 RepID=UPI0004CD3B43|nr:nucleolar MIF4G domain-containing protein 1 homolog [Microplitis demolitor]
MKVKSKKSNKNKKPIQKTRKELRKEKRIQKKVNRAQYHNKKKLITNNNDNDTEVKNKKINKNDDIDVVKKKPAKKVKTNEDLAKEKVKRENKQQKRAERRRLEQRKLVLQQDNEKEDKMIKQLEKKLKLNKRKSKSTPKSFADDGLDYLLDFCNDEESFAKKIDYKAGTMKDALMELDSSDDDFDDESPVKKKKKVENSDAEKKEELNSESDQEFSDDFDEEDLDDDDDDEPVNKVNKSQLKSLNSNKKSKLNSESDDDFDDSEEGLDDSDDEPSVKKIKSTSKTSNANRKSKLNPESEDDDSNIDEDDSDDSGDEPVIEKINKSKSKALNSTKKPEPNSESDEFDDEDAFDDGEEDEEEEDDDNKAEKNSDGTWEDIYGRKRDKDGNIIDEKSNSGKYIPPAARLKQLEESTAHQEKLERLRKQLKGLINRLAEHNMHTISSQIDEMYMSNSRNDMNEMLSRLMTESLVSPVLTPDRLVAEHMMLIAILHANVGTEVGAHFLLSLVKKINEMLDEPQDVLNKSLDNFILMLAHLYNFKVYGSQLLYQILKKLADKFTEKEIECILLILKTVGFLLRKDDPAALKELIISLQQKAAANKSTNSRIQFMLDVLMAIKNNNMNKIPQYDPSHVEHLKKLLKSFLRKGNSVTQFNISLSDLLNANEKGKWWIVGSAWTGNIDSANKSTKEKHSDGSIQFSQQILELARKQRMNTDVRRNIFCILMSAEDYLDAFEKIQHLGLKDQPGREIIYVIMDCCLQEKKFNPYYAVLAQKFCDYDRKNQMTLQYSLWDKLKTLDSFNKVQLNNLAKFFSHLFINKGLPLSVLKVISFAELDQPTMKLIRKIMLEILLHDDLEACVQAFERISLAAQLQNLREGLRLFISYFLANYAAKKLPDKSVQRLKQRTELVEKVLYTRSSRL